jgi:hypothetical protein
VDNIVKPHLGPSLTRQRVKDHTGGIARYRARRTETHYGFRLPSVPGSLDSKQGRVAGKALAEWAYGRQSHVGCNRNHAHCHPCGHLLGATVRKPIDTGFGADPDCAAGTFAEVEGLRWREPILLQQKKARAVKPRRLRSSQPQTAARILKQTLNDSG